MKPALIIFAKAPGPGVKTRLSGVLSESARIELYRRLLEGTIARLRVMPGVEKYIAHSPGGEGFFRRYGMWMFEQRGEGLGPRMHNAIAHVIDGLGHDAAVLVGGDIPELGPDVVADALEALAEGADAVFGPAEDGGYYLVAIKRPAPDVFEGIEWSRPDTLERTLERARGMGLRVSLVRELWDVDRPEDIGRLGM